jgi:hypothetical protein
MPLRHRIAHLPHWIIGALAVHVGSFGVTSFAFAAEAPAATRAEAPAADATSLATEAAPLQAVWKEQRIDFNLVSFTSFYSCGGLEDRLKKIMNALGVRAKVRVSAPGCDSGVVRFPRVILTAQTPVEATPEALADLEKGRSTRELAARVKGQKIDPEETAPFAAHWKAVSLSRGKLDIEPGDCELIDEVRKKVLPKLSVRIVNDDVSCSPNQVSLGQPRLEVEALVASPKADDPADKKHK